MKGRQKGKSKDSKRRQLMKKTARGDRRELQVKNRRELKVRRALDMKRVNYRSGCTNK